MTSSWTVPRRFNNLAREFDFLIMIDVLLPCVFLQNFVMQNNSKIVDLDLIISKVIIFVTSLQSIDENY